MDNQTEFEVDDAIVLLLGAPSKSPSLQDRLEGITRLEKLLFLLKNETLTGKLLTENPEFTAHNFGPFSEKAYQAIDTLAAAQLIIDSARQANTRDDTWEAKTLIGNEPADDYATRDFELTALGKKYYRSLISELPRSTESELKKLKAKFGSLPLRQLVRYVYEGYPTYTENSVIRDRILES